MFAILSRTTNRRVGKGYYILLTLAPRYEGLPRGDWPGGGWR